MAEILFQQLSSVEVNLRDKAERFSVSSISTRSVQALPIFSKHCPVEPSYACSRLVHLRSGPRNGKQRSHIRKTNRGSGQTDCVPTSGPAGMTVALSASRFSQPRLPMAEISCSQHSSWELPCYKCLTDWRMGHSSHYTTF